MSTPWTRPRSLVTHGHVSHVSRPGAWFSDDDEESEYCGVEEDHYMSPVSPVSTPGSQLTCATMLSPEPETGENF